MIFIKLSLLPALFQLIMLSGCHSGQQASGGTEKTASLVLNGKVPKLSAEQEKEVVSRVLDYLKGCDDFYELLVTENLLSSIRNSGDFLEITFPEAMQVSTDKFGDLELDRVLIPLSGRFAGNDQLTFFSGKGDFSNTPLIRTAGKAQLLKMTGDQ